MRAIMKEVLKLQNNHKIIIKIK